jgi:hypothetical protein
VALGFGAGAAGDVGDRLDRVVERFDQQSLGERSAVVAPCQCGAEQHAADADDEGDECRDRVHRTGAGD